MEVPFNQIIGAFIVPVGPRSRGIPDSAISNGQLGFDGRVEENDLLDSGFSGQTEKKRHVFLAAEEGDIVFIVRKHAEVAIEVRFAPALEWRRHRTERNIVLGKQELGTDQTPAGREYEDFAPAEFGYEPLVDGIVIEPIRR